MKQDEWTALLEWLVVHAPHVDVTARTWGLLGG